MTGKLDVRRRGLLSGTAGIAVAAAMVFGTAGLTHADPTDEPAPVPTTTSSPAPAPVAAPVTVPSAVASTTGPKPTVALQGGAATGAVAAGGAATTTAATGATTGDVLDQLADEYATGAGGGQLSNLLKVSLKLRSMGYKPSKQYLDELSAAMKARPNQLPLIGALKDTIAYQQKLKAQSEVLSNAQAAQGGGAAMGAGSAPGFGTPGAPVSVAAVPVGPPPTP